MEIDDMDIVETNLNVASNKEIVNCGALDCGEGARRRRELNDLWLGSLYGTLKRYFARRLSNWNEIDDLVQETLIKVHKYTVDYDVQIDAGEYRISYVYRNAANVLTDSLRKKTVRRHQYHTHIEGVAEGEWLMATSSVTSDPEGVVEMQQCQNHLNQCLAALSSRTRSIFLLSRFSGLSAKQISLEEQVSISCVEKHLSKARSALYEFYKMM